MASAAAPTLRLGSAKIAGERDVTAGERDVTAGERDVTAGERDVTGISKAASLPCAQSITSNISSVIQTWYEVTSCLTSLPCGGLGGINSVRHHVAHSGVLILYFISFHPRDLGKNI